MMRVRCHLAIHIDVHLAVVHHVYADTEWIRVCTYQATVRLDIRLDIYLDVNLNAAR